MITLEDIVEILNPVNTGAQVAESPVLVDMDQHYESVTTCDLWMA